eukprot:scaffold55710_cov39-Prasinocladus_malaysianus.AAC.1
MTLDRTKLDLRGVFEPGMAYVALSRCRSLEGIELMGFNTKKMTCSPKVRHAAHRLAHRIIVCLGSPTQSSVTVGNSLQGGCSYQRTKLNRIPIGCFQFDIHGTVESLGYTCLIHSDSAMERYHLHQSMCDRIRACKYGVTRFYAELESRAQNPTAWQTFSKFDGSRQELLTRDSWKSLEHTLKAVAKDCFKYGCLIGLLMPMSIQGRHRSVTKSRSRGKYWPERS